MKVKLYVEGGGDSKSLHTRCREGFRKLLESAGFSGRMPRITACGARHKTFDDFKTAIRSAEPTDHPMLLVDSEAPIKQMGKPWEHLKSHDGWDRPPGAGDDQAQLMVQCMETWLLADQAAMRAYFGEKLQHTALPPTDALEARAKDEVQSALAKATRLCGPDKEYKKGKRSFELLASLNAATLRETLPHFDQLCIALDARTAD